MNAGDILLHTDFTFHDGTKGTKLLVVLNDPDLKKGEPYLAIKTTSRLKGKQMTAGCLATWRIFYIEPTKEEFFDKPTLLQLDDIYELDASSVIQNGIEQTLKQVGKLSELLFRQLKNCIKQIKEDISEKHYQMIFKKN